MRREPKDFYFVWETDEGWADFSVVNIDLAAATRELSRRFPEDVGSDGTVTLGDGTQLPIDW